MCLCSEGDLIFTHRCNTREDKTSFLFYVKSGFVLELLEAEPFSLTAYWLLNWLYFCLYWLYFCFLCNKNKIKGLWVHKGWPSFGLEPALVLQWTLPWPYNIPDMALYILAIFLHSIPQKWDQGTLGTHRLTPIGSRTRLGPSMDPAMAFYATKMGPMKDQGGS